jgi:N-acetylmuramoyl-L-alanine amidase
VDPLALAGLCAVLARGQDPGSRPAGLTCPPAAVAPVQWAPGPGVGLREALDAPGARDGIARVAFAEAGNQGDSGLAGVIYTILNRLEDGRWGSTVDGVLNARSQFEPVMRAGGDWRGLMPVSSAAQAHVDTILNLAIDGRLPDLTHGARYFQNPAIVASRARAGEGSPGLVNFGGATPSAVIGAHSFYAATGRGGAAGTPVRPAGAPPSEGAMFVGETRLAATLPEAGPAPVASAVSAPLGPSVGDPGRALFVSRDGRVRADQP